MARRHAPRTDAQRIARRMYNMQPQVRQMKAIKRAIKKHQSPPAISFGAPKPPVGTV